MIEYLVRRARRDGTRLIVEADGLPATWLAVDPTGTVDRLDHHPGPTPVPASTPASTSSGTRAPSTVPGAPTAVPESAPHPAPDPVLGVAASPPALAPAGRLDAVPRGLRQTTFLIPDQPALPARQGWRSAMNGLGLQIPPSQEELAERADEQVVSQHWPGPRTVAVVNRKGGGEQDPRPSCCSPPCWPATAASLRAGLGQTTSPKAPWAGAPSKAPTRASVLDLVDSSTRLLSPETSTRRPGPFRPPSGGGQVRRAALGRKRRGRPRGHRRGSGPR